VLLAQQDSRTPFVVVASAAAFNLVFDVALIAGVGLGLPGAAIATVVTQYLALAAFLFSVTRRGRIAPRFGAAPAGSSNGSRSPYGASSREPLLATSRDGRTAEPSPNGLKPRIAAAAVRMANATADLRENRPQLLSTATPEELHARLSVDSSAPFRASVDVAPAAPRAADDTMRVAVPASAEAAVTSATPVAAAPAAPAAVVVAAPARAAFTAPAQEASTSAADIAVLTAVYAAKLACYYMVQLTAMRFDLTQLAAHNALFALWNVFAYVPVPLQSTALAFIPAATTREVRFATDRRMRGATLLKLPLHTGAAHDGGARAGDGGGGCCAARARVLGALARVPDRALLQCGSLARDVDHRRAERAVHPLLLR